MIDAVPRGSVEGANFAGGGLRVYPCHAGASQDRGFLNRFKDLAARDRLRVHRLVDSPADADVILILDVNEHAHDPGLKAVRAHPLVTRYRDRVMVYNELDQPWCALPGLYVSMPRPAFDAARQRACPYILQEINPHLREARGAGAGNLEPDLLYSFVGRDCHPVRAAVLGLRHARGVTVDTTAYNFFSPEAGVPDQSREQYAQTLARSKFVLCPRGAGTSSYRLYEAMRAGRVPVILSDDWVPPTGPAWDACSVRLSEQDAAQVPQVLEAIEPQFDAMSRAAATEWANWFAPDVLFHRMTSWAGEVLRARRWPEALSQRLPNRRGIWLRARSWGRELLGGGLAKRGIGGRG